MSLTKTERMMEKNQASRVCAREGCQNVFTCRRSKRGMTKKYCSPECVSRSMPSYIKNTKLIETCSFYLSLGFTAEQVWQDFIEGDVAIESWLKTLERRNEVKMLKQFRAFGVSSGMMPDRRKAIPDRAA